MPRALPVRLALVALLAVLGLTAWFVRGSGLAASGRERERRRAEPTVTGPHVAPAPAIPVHSAGRRPDPASRSTTPERSRATFVEEPRRTAGLSVRGLVVDDRGVACSSFRVRATRLDLVEESSVEQGFEVPDGWFELEGLATGDWELVARGAEGLDSDPTAVALPGSSAPRLIVPRASSVRGFVLGQDGSAVADARVWCEGSEGGRGPLPETRSDAGGAFDLTGLAPGVAALVARAPGLAPGPAIVLDLLPGEARADVVLRMRPGSRILGEVLDASGQPERGVRVSASRPPTSVVTDDEGRFELGGLSAGVQELRATTAEGLELRREVELEEGATERVRLGVPADATVRLHGEVTAEGLETVEGRVRAERVDDEGLAVACAADLVEGAYELLLPGPGDYELSVALRSEGAAEIGWRNRIDVPALDEVERDLAVPLGRITGRVTDRAGIPLPGVGVETTPERHGREHGATRTRTTAGGHFALTVAPGLHTVIAGARLGLSPGARDEGTHTQARAESVPVAAGETVELADLVVSRSGTLEGSARRADGTPVIEASLWSYLGDRADRLGRIENGAFRLEGLDPGTLVVGAAGGGEATRVPVTVTIGSGTTMRIELQLEPATRVHVQARDAGGALVGCDIDALDAHGVPVALERGTTGEAWLGPLPPGEYVVGARRDGRRLERVFAVHGGGPELRIDLVLE